MLTVFKASAGSGKTFRLVVEFLKLLLRDEHNYRHILAVTFTNKATAEMKERVLYQLAGIAAGESASYQKTLLEETEWSDTELKSKAAEILENILFDFSRFSISTIDKFTQKIIRSFNREVGITPDFTLELDSELIIDEAVDRLIAGIGNNQPLQAWLEGFIEEKIRNHRNFSVEKDLKSLGRELFRETLQNRLGELQNFFADPARKQSYLDMLNSIIYSLESKIFTIAGKMVSGYTSHGFTADDFSGKSRGIAGFIEKIAGRFMPAEISRSAYNAAESEDKWVTRTHPRRAEITALVRNELLPGLNELIQHYQDNIQFYLTAKAIKSEWYTLSVLLDLSREIDSLNREKSVLPIASSNALLKAIIDGNDTPFIYEKTGHYYRHFLLDEFQDTSVMQWENFKPLIANGMAQGSFNLAVGDVKQSIYRWRNSDWSILAARVFSSFQGYRVNEIQLDKNYRSDERIVQFNNTFFESFIGQIQEIEKLKPVMDHYRPVFGSIYADLRQKQADVGNKDGFVAAEFIHAEEETFNIQSLRRMTDRIKQLQDAGIKAGEIAILVRKNDQGAEVVQYLMNQSNLAENSGYNLKVLSNESLFLSSSPAVNFVIAVVRNLANRDDLLNRAVMLHLHDWLTRKEILPVRTNTPSPGSGAWYYASNPDELFNTTIAPGISEVSKDLLTSGIDEIIIRICHVFGLFEISDSLPYLQALMDKTSAVKKNKTNDLSGFLEWWEEKGYKESVQVNEQTDAIRLLTIHKSKGLEFKAVLIPFFSWKLVDYKNNILWCSPATAPFHEAPVVPVAFREQLAGTIFSDAYYLEYFNQLVDNINLAYVAFTRARSILIIHSPAGNTATTVGGFFEQTIREMAGNGQFDPDWKCDAACFESGSFETITPKHHHSMPENIRRWTYHPFGDRLLLHAGKESLSERIELGTTPIERGNLLHAVLSEVKTSGDVENAVQRARLQGLLSEETALAVKSKLTDMLSHPLAAGWFDGSYSVWNEKDLLTPENIYRPDRIMISGNQAVVVDFKSGESKKTEYHRQVLKYCDILLNAGISDVTGYIWYTNNNHIERVI